MWHLEYRKNDVYQPTVMKKYWLENNRVPIVYKTIKLIVRYIFFKALVMHTNVNVSNTISLMT